MEEERVIHNGRIYIVELLTDKMKNDAKELRELEARIEEIRTLYPIVHQLSKDLYDDYVKETNQKPKSGFGV